MFTRNLLLLAFFLAGFTGLAQSQLPESAVVKYDPLFWKDDLNLKAEQRNRINEINLKFYQNIQEEFQTASNDRSALKVKIDKSLEVRSQEIWNTLHPKQRKKWEKMMRSYGDYQI